MAYDKLSTSQDNDDSSRIDVIHAIRKVMAQPIPEPPAHRLEAAFGPMWRQTITRTKQRAALSVSLGLNGLRCGEVVGFRTRDLDRTASTLRIRTIKKGRPRIITLDPEFSEALWRCALAWRRLHDPLPYPE